MVWSGPSRSGPKSSSALISRLFPDLGLRLSRRPEFVFSGQAADGKKKTFSESGNPLCAVATNELRQRTFL